LDEFERQSIAAALIQEAKRVTAVLNRKVRDWVRPHARLRFLRNDPKLGYVPDGLGAQ
jgi:hypothetical protein